MMKIISVFLISVLFCNYSFATCDFSKGITSLPDGNYEYSKECHLAVGQLVQDNATKDVQIQDLTKAISLKDLAIKASDDRATLWSNTSQNLENRLQKVDSLQSKNQLLMFALGAFTVIGAGFMTARLIGR